MTATKQEQQPVEVRLNDFASQENCDGPEYDCMVEAAGEIKRLRNMLAEVGNRNTDLNNQVVELQKYKNWCDRINSAALNQDADAYQKVLLQINQHIVQRDGEAKTDG